MSVFDFFFFNLIILTLMWDYSIAFSRQCFVQYTARLCSGGCSHIMPDLSYCRDSSEVLLFNFGVILVISEVLGKSDRQIKWCCSMTSGGVYGESKVLYFS